MVRLHCAARQILETARAGPTAAHVLGWVNGLAPKVDLREARGSSSSRKSGTNSWKILFESTFGASPFTHVLGWVNGLAPKVDSNRIFQLLVPDFLLLLLPRASRNRLLRSPVFALLRNAAVPAAMAWAPRPSSRRVFARA
jgi:hypothetical protein